MSDVLLPLLPTFALAAYLFYVIFCEVVKRPNGGSKKPVESVTDQLKPTVEKVAKEVSKPEPKADVVPVKAAQKPVEPIIDEVKQTEEKPAKTETVAKDLAMPDYYRNPKTNELAPVPNNYRFAKRWIKKALVEEGLLGKVYRNNEMNDKNSKKVKKALEALAMIPKYRG